MGFDGLAVLIQWNWKLIARWEPVFYTKYRNFLIYFIILYNTREETEEGENKRYLVQ